MGVSLTNILTGAGISTAANALFPGAGMADAFVRSAGMGLGNGLMRTAVTPNRPGVPPNRMGGPGAPEGAMPTRKFGSTRETVGELRSGFKDWLVDPLQAKKEKREQARDTALAVRLGITGGEYSLTHRPAMSLIKKRSGDVQTNIMILQFRVQQFMARNLSAIASTLGVPKSKIGHEEPDPNRSWFGSLLSSIHKDLQENKIFSTLESIGKHAINIGRILNPFTMGARAGKAAKSFGEFMQKLALGKEGYEFMKDPTKVYEKAGVKQDFQTKSVNLMKVNNEYQKLQLNMLYNVVGIGEELLGVLGVQYKRKRIDITHDEYSGTLKTHAEAARSQRMRDKKVETIQKIASRRGLGRLSPIYSTLKTGFQKAQSALNKNEANSRDRYVLAQMFENNDLENFRGLTPALTRFIDSLPEDIDFTDERNQALADQFKKLLNEALSTRQQDNAKESKRRRLVNSRSQARSAETYNTMFDSSYDLGAAVANLFSSLTGKQAVNMRKREHIHKLRAFEKYQDFNMALTENGGFLEALINAGYDENVVRQIARSLGGPAEGIRQQFQRGSVSRNLEENLRRTPRETPINEIMGYDKTNPFYRPGGLRGFALTELENAAQKDLEALTYQANLVELEDGVIKKLKKPTYNMSVYNFTKDAVDQLEKINYTTKIIDIDDVSIDKIKKAEYSVRLVGIGGNVVQDAQPLFKSFFAGLRGVADYLVTLIFDRMPLRGSQRTPIEVHQIAAKGGIFTGSDISELENQIITQPTLFQYDDIHQFAKGGTVAGQGRNTPAGRPKRWGASGRGKRTGLAGEGKKINKKYRPEAIIPLAENEKGELGVEKVDKKKAIDEDDNTKTQAERDKEREKKEEKKEQEKKEEEQKVNEEEKKTLLQRISDLLDPRSKLNKLIGKFKEKKDKGSDFKLPFDISSWISKLGIGMIGTALYKALPEGLFTGEDGIFSKLWKFTKDSIVKIFEKAKDYVSEHAFDWFKGAWDHFHEHPLLDAGILMTIFPGTVGKILSKVAGKALSNPAAIPAMLGIGGMVYNLIDAFTKSKDETGEFSLGKFLSEFFLGSSGGVVGTLSKAASWGWMGAKIGAMFGGVGAVPGMLVGAALGALVGSTDSRDEQGNFSWGKFFKNLAVGNDAAGGLANGGKQFLKWGLVGGAFGGPVGFLLAGSIGGLLGVVGADGFSKLYKMGEASGQTVAKFFKWEKGSFAYKAATCGAANAIPYVGAFIFGALGSILDLGGMLIKGLWGWVKSFLPQSVVDRIEGNKSEYEKKFDEQNKIEVKATEKDADVQGNVFDREYKMNVNEKDAAYINDAKTDNEKLKRYRLIEAQNNRRKHWGTEATEGVNGKKYNPEKYIALKEKWAEEDRKRDEIYSHEIDVPWYSPGVSDFNSTQENAKQYQELYKINPEDAVKFATEVFNKQEEEKNKREATRASMLKKIEVGSSPDDLKLDAQRKASSVPAATAAKLTVDKQSYASGKELGLGSNPDDLKLDAQRKASSAPAAMSAKLGVGDDDDDDMGSNVDVTHLQEATQKGMNEWVDQHKPSKETQERIGTYITQLKEKAKKGTKEWIDKYNEWNEKNKPSKEEQARINAYNKAASEIDLSSAGLGTSAPGPEPVTPEKDKKKEEIPLYRRPENIAKYNAAAQNIDLSSAGLGLSAPGPDPSSVPAAAKASEDASKKKDENKGKSGTPAPSASPASAPVETSAPSAPSGETPASTPSGGGQLNWIENLISKTIQNTFKAGEAIFGAAKTAYNTAQQTLNGGPGGPGGGGEVGSWGGGFSNAEYLPGKPGAASLGTHFITAKPKDPRNRPGRNNNPLNVKLSKKGLDKADEQGHRIFGNVDDGIRGNFWQLQRYINGTYLNGKFGQLNTARKIIPVWAPVKDGNNPTQYLAELQSWGVNIDEPIDLNSPSSLDPLAKLMAGMARKEGWGIINPEEIKKVLTYGNHQGAPGTAQSTGDAAAAPTNAPEAVRNYLAIMGKNAQGAKYSNKLRNKPGYYDCSSFTARSLADAGIFPRSVVDGQNAPTTGDLPSYLQRYGFKFHPYNFTGVKNAPPELQPGDILTANKAQTGGRMGHVVTYWGDNKIIAAHRPGATPQVGVKPFYTSKQGGYWRYSPGGGSNPEDLLNKTGQTTTENMILPNSAKTPSLFKKLKKTLGAAKLSWPTISSKINSDYGTRDPSQFAGVKGKISRNHGGVDIQAAEGDPVYATMSGTVVGTDPDYGTIEVQHPNGWLSKYLHLGKFIARAGEQVKSGQIIGEAGGVGKGGKTDAFNPHLHFELIKGKTKIPPLQMVAAAGIDKPTPKEQEENSNAAGYGGPEFTPRINKQMNEYLENNGVGGPEISVKSDNRVIAELKKLQVIMMGVMKAAGKPSIAVSAPQQSGGGNPQNQVDESGASDVFTDSAFSQIGGLLPNLNVSMTGLGTSIA